MYPKWLVFALTLLSFLFLITSAAPVAEGETAPVKRLKQFQPRRADADDNILARDGTVVERAKRSEPSPKWARGPVPSQRWARSPVPSQRWARSPVPSQKWARSPAPSPIPHL